MSIAGCDISNNQGGIDWALVSRGGMVWAAAKVSEGTFFTDTFFPANWAGMRANNIARVAYHFCRPDRSTAEAEVAYFVARLKDAGGLVDGDVLVGDFERGNGDLSAWALAWLQGVEAAVGVKPLVYSGVWFMQPHGLLIEALSTYGLWLASYQSAEPAPPAPWPLLAAWQYTDTGAVPGVVGSCDLDLFFGTVEQLKQYGLQKPAKPVLDDKARLQGCAYLAGGSGVQDMATWLAGFTD